MTPQSASILVACENRTAWVKVEGKGSFHNSGGLKEFANRMLARGLTEFVIDLQDCPVMDSTFMGTLTALALKLQERGEGGVHLIHLNARNRDLLTGLGLLHLFKVNDAVPQAAMPAKTERLTGPVGGVAGAKTMLEAHEAIIEAAPQNLDKFKDVLEFLRQDIDGAS